MNRKIKLFTIAALSVLAVMLVASAPAHAQTCDQTLKNMAMVKTQATAILTIPGDGSPNSGCTKIFIDYVSASLFDSVENCMQWFYITQSTNLVELNDGLSTGTASEDQWLARLPVLPPPGYFFFTGHSGGTVGFVNHCANSIEFVNLTYHYMP
jgi:hypothetical protein